MSLLRKIGVEVAHLANNGQEAAEAAAAHPFDVIFMDIQARPSAAVRWPALL